VPSARIATSSIAPSSSSTVAEPGRRSKPSSASPALRCEIVEATEPREASLQAGKESIVTICNRCKRSDVPLNDGMILGPIGYHDLDDRRSDVALCKPCRDAVRAAAEACLNNQSTAYAYTLPRKPSVARTILTIGTWSLFWTALWEFAAWCVRHPLHR
jgi:hypothetical protein